MSWERASGACEICHEEPAMEIHHLFPQTKRNKILYGKLIHSRENTMALCKSCHIYAPHINEKEFCRRLGIQTRSKSGKL